VRTAGDPAAIVPAIRDAVKQIDRNLPLNRVRTQEQQLESEIGRERAFAQLSVFFGSLALALVCVGLYGLMSYTVICRTGEIGLRMALGALPRSVLGMIVGESIVLTGLGVLIGLAAAFGAARLISGLLYGVLPVDPITYAVVAVVLIAVAAAAAFLPAWRAAKIDPMVALRTE
jgi:ABC-type antimicrobial peptide transport system permease subunit